MATRTKKTILQNISEHTYQECLAAYAKSEAEIRKINAEIDLQTQKIREKYADRLKSFSTIKDESFDVVMQYAEEHPELFHKKRSVDTAFGVLGYRLGTPKLATRKGFQWKAVLDLLKEKFPKFVKVKEDVNKEAILADKELTDHDLKSIGVEIIQEDSFYIDLKTEEID
ncbi:MAG: host-nuclease inhibitor Gam family protein [Chitinophagales bacterium]|jgi:phage host-nuclease inhibitor protein Gam|nr:host-nuclease inhibitor Gam family protein [Chitinophagales bacterium]